MLAKQEWLVQVALLGGALLAKRPRANHGRAGVGGAQQGGQVGLLVAGALARLHIARSEQEQRKVGGGDLAHAY